MSNRNYNNKPVKQYETVDILHPPLNEFDVSYEKKYTCRMGQLYPIFQDFAYPGEMYKLGHEHNIRTIAQKFATMHKVEYFVHFYAVPIRLLWEQWFEYLANPTAEAIEPLPLWSYDEEGGEDPLFAKLKTLWDAFEMPVEPPKIKDEGGSTIDNPNYGIPPHMDNLPVAWLQMAYNLIYNEYYRDQDLEEEIPLNSNQIRQRWYEKNYFTSARPNQQKGTPIAIPIGGLLPVGGLMNEHYQESYGPTQPSRETLWQLNINTPLAPVGDTIIPIDTDQTGQSSINGFYANSNIQKPNYPTTPINPPTSANTNVKSNQFIFADAKNAITFGVSDLRHTFSIQGILERNSRSGTRDVEWVKSHFGTTLPDYRVGRPEYIGGTKKQISFGEVMQTGAGNEQQPLGTIGGRGDSKFGDFCGKYYAREHCVIIGLGSIRPTTAYQQGINCKWLKKHPLEYYMPEMANLSEKPIYQREIYVQPNTIDTTGANGKITLGWQGHWDEHRQNTNQVCGDMRWAYNYMHLGIIFNSAPNLNKDMGTINPNTRIFNIISDSEGNPVDEWLVQVGNHALAKKPMPLINNPGLIDHSYGENHFRRY